MIYITLDTRVNLPLYEKNAFCCMQKGADQPASPSNLSSIFVIYCLENIVLLYKLLLYSAMYIYNTHLKNMDLDMFGSLFGLVLLCPSQ